LDPRRHRNEKRRPHSEIDRLEWHGKPAEIPGLEVVATGTTKNTGGRRRHLHATVYPGPKNNIVFNASTIWWGDGTLVAAGLQTSERLHLAARPDPRVQQMMHNVMKRMKK